MPWEINLSPDEETRNWFFWVKIISPFSPGGRWHEQWEGAELQVGHSAKQKGPYDLLKIENIS